MPYSSSSSSVRHKIPGHFSSCCISQTWSTGFPLDNFHFHQCAIVLVREGLYIYLLCFQIFWKFNCVASLILCICRRQSVYNCYKICCRTSYKDVLGTFSGHGDHFHCVIWHLGDKKYPVLYITECFWEICRRQSV